MLHVHFDSRHIGLRLILAMTSKCKFQNICYNTMHPYQVGLASTLKETPCPSTEAKNGYQNTPIFA